MTGRERARVASVSTSPWPLIGIVALGALVRIPTLSVQSLFSDEGFTAKIATAHLSSAVSQVPHTESTPPLYYAVAWVWAHVFGASEFMLRLPSAIFGSLTIVAVYWAAVAISTRRVALIAAGLTAVSPIMVWYSQEARAYALFVLLSVLALGFFFRALQDRRAAWLAGWAVCTSAALATHYFALFPFVAEASWLVLRAPERRRVLVALALPVIIGGALAPLAHYQQAHVPRSWTFTFSVADQAKAIAQSFLVGITWTQVTHRLGVAVLGLLALVAGAALARYGNAHERRVGLGLTALAGVSLAIPAVISLVGANYLAPRNVLYVWPMVAMIVALGAGRQNAGRVSLAALATGGAVSLAIVIAVPFTHGLQRQDWRGLLRPLARSGSPRALVVADGFNDPPVIEYYLRGVTDLKQATQVEEVDVVTDVRQQAAVAAQLLPVSGLRLIAQESRGALVVSRFVASTPISISPASPRPSGASVLVQPQRAAPIPR